MCGSNYLCMRQIAHALARSAEEVSLAEFVKNKFADFLLNEKYTNIFTPDALFIRPTGNPAVEQTWKDVCSPCLFIVVVVVVVRRGGGGGAFVVLLFLLCAASLFRYVSLPAAFAYVCTNAPIGTCVAVADDRHWQHQSAQK